MLDDKLKNSTTLNRAFMKKIIMEASYTKPADEPISRSSKESNPQWLPLLKNLLKRKETNILLNDHEQNRTKGVNR